MGYDIFLSYRRADQPLARKLVEALEKRGVGVWWDQMIEAGVDWREAIVDGLMDSDMLVILFSDECNSSKQLKKELALADDMDKNVVPVLIEDIKPKGHFLYELASRNWIQVFPDPHKKIEELAERLTRVAEASPGGLEGKHAPKAQQQAAQAQIPPPIVEEIPHDLSVDEALELPPEPQALGAPPPPEPTLIAPSAPAVDSRVVNAAQKKPKAAEKQKAAKKRKRRNFLPFKWYDFLLLVPAFIFFLVSEGSTDFDRIRLEDMTEVLAMASIGLAGFGALVFPIRYFMRKLRLKSALGYYAASSVALYGLLLFAGLWYASMEGGFLEVIEVVAGFGLVWIGFGVLAFAVYGILHFQRTIRSFRSNVEKI